MTIVTAGPDKVVWSEDVLAFARAAGVEQYLDPLLEVTRELFPGAGEIRVFVSQDLEIADLRAIAWEVDLPVDEPHESSDRQRQWVRAFMKRCPPTHLHFFVRSIRRSDESARLP
jgi:hypothetical protein